ncbi:family 43 glycosylhydrolase [Promicromonospora sukumoe]|uniref:Beta-xylosidase n=1 Tax=Promicromonospora sukumoe TaxID=88382 RepID=A0A7W3PFH8_9MICO|nr:family 43 glycosylhydrolase [Promicromonospora sukumoe]MBA8809637.1 beta-xylosidase [Promicromonospora sukumoe]
MRLGSDQRRPVRTAWVAACAAAVLAGGLGPVVPAVADADVGTVADAAAGVAVATSDAADVATSVARPTAAVPPTSAGLPSDATPATYTNPVSAGVTDTFPDPAVIRGKDGAWYAYGTQNPVFNSQGEPGERILPILRSTDLVTWEYAGEVIQSDDVPATWRDNSRAWAPDIRYVDGEYLLTYGLSTGGLAVATAPTPTGPWTHGDELLVPSAPIDGCPTGNIDQALFTDDDGTLYLYWGSYDVLCVSELTPGAGELTGPVTQVAQGRRAEGAYVVRHDDLYYLMYSDAGCCEGAFSGYTVKVGRSDSPVGPFVDDDGTDLMAESSKGGYVLTSNGDGYAGPGHHSLITDLAGQDWMAYHAIPEADPDFPPVDTRNGVLNLSKRPLMIDRLDWIDGWPVVNAGAGPSSGPQRAPVTSGPVSSTFADGSLAGWRAGGDVVVGQEPDTGPYAALDGATLTSRDRAGGDLRAQADLRVADDDGAAGLALGTGAGRVTAWVDRAAGELRLETGRGPRAQRAATPLPDNFPYGDWNVVTLDREARSGAYTATVSADNLKEPLGSVGLTVRGAAGRVPVGVTARGAAAADNVSLVPAARPVTERVPDPQPGALLPEHSDEFDGDVVPGTGAARTGADGAGAETTGAANTGWTWVRGPAAGVRLDDGALTWPTQNAELYQGTNTASVLTRDAPTGDYLVETKLTLDGVGVNRQAGLVLYADDDQFVKLVHSQLGLLRKPGSAAQTVEFTKEAARTTSTPPSAAYSAPMFGPAPGETTWLRLAVHRDAANAEYEVRMASSTDGETWRWGGVWTLPDDQPLRTGLVAMNTAGATATFDYVRTYALP